MKKVILFIIMFFSCFMVTKSFAGTYVVTKFEDTNDGLCDSDCSLREAVIAANMNAGPDTINLREGVYFLTLLGANEDMSATGDLDIRDDLTIKGVVKTSYPVIDGTQKDRVLDIFSGSTVIITDVGVQNGILTSGSGAGLYNRGNTTLDRVYFTGNVASSYGGAIQSRSENNDWTSAQLNIKNSYFSRNCSDSGGAMDSSGVTSIVNSRFDGNVPVIKGGIDCKNLDGAAINGQGGYITIDKSTFINNIGEVGAINSYGSYMVITNTTITNNRGTGFYGAGGVFNEMAANISIINSTISKNISQGSGGGVASMTLAEAIYPIVVINSIIANNNASSGAGADCFGKIQSDGSNVFGTVADCPVVLQASDIVGNPQLGGLVTTTNTPQQSYFPLLMTSPAIDSANKTNCPSQDQAGKLRPIDGNGDGIAICDRGAFEIETVTVDVCPAGCRYSNIQEALNAAAAGATVRVGTGTYQEAVEVSGGKKLVSANGAVNTVINASGKGTRGVTIKSGLVEGFTITGGLGGIEIQISGTVRKNRIINNITTAGGGGIYVGDYSSASILSNHIANNRASYGGGIHYGYYSTVTISGNTIDANIASKCGGGIHLPSYAAETIRSNTLMRNSAETGGGLCINSYAAPAILSNLLIVRNSATLRGGGIYAASYNYAQLINSTVTENSVTNPANGAGIFPEGYSSLEILNSIVWGNNGVDIYPSWGYSVASSIVGAAEAGGNVVADPLFVNPAVWNYRVKSGSPAIDTGRSTASSGVVNAIDGTPRPQDGDGLGKGSTGDGSDYDIGVYEFRR